MKNRTKNFLSIIIIFALIFYCMSQPWNIKPNAKKLKKFSDIKSKGSAINQKNNSQ